MVVNLSGKSHLEKILTQFLKGLRADNKALARDPGDKLFLLLYYFAPNLLNNLEPTSVLSDLVPCSIEWGCSGNQILTLGCLDMPA